MKNAPTFETADVRFDWFELASGVRARIVRLTHIPTGIQVKGRGRTVNEAMNNGIVQLKRRLARWLTAPL